MLGKARFLNLERVDGNYEDKNNNSLIKMMIGLCGVGFRIYYVLDLEFTTIL